MRRHPRTARPARARTGRGSIGVGLLAGLAAATLCACAPDVGSDGGTAAGRSLLPDAGRFSRLPEEPRASASSAFWEWWGDGRAELSGYRITTPRYGAAREGTLVLIYVTEPHDRRVWIKDDEAAADHRVEVMKLNASLEFLTGIYPYSVMTSVFSPVDDWGPARFQPVKVTASVQEWCGSWFAGLWPGRDRLRWLRLSYFDDEGERIGEVRAGEDVLYEDALPIQLRELDGPFAGGGDWEGEIVPGLWEVRRGHGEPVPVPGAITRETAEREGIPVSRFTVRVGDRTRTVDVERAPPRRILGWETSGGERAELLATERLAYWRLNGPEGRAVRERLGLDTEGYAPGGEGGC